MPDKRLFQIMNNLLYPAVLGTLLYTFVDKRIPGMQLFEPEFIGACALFLLFVFDYAHSSSDEVRSTYDAKKFLFDLLIISFLFLAGKDILNDALLPNIDFVWWLFLSKLAAVFWEISERKDRQKSHAAQVSARPFPFPLIYIETDAALCIAYAAIAGFALANLDWWPWAAAICMGVDAYFYWRYTA